MIQPKTQLFGAKIRKMKTVKSTVKQEFGRKRGNGFFATCHSIGYRTQKLDAIPEEKTRGEG